MMPKKIRYQATRIDTTYRVTDGQTKVRIPAAIPKIPPMMYSQRHSSTRPAAASWVMPPNRKATPTKAATTVRLPTRYDSTYMPNQTHRTPRIKNHHQTPETSRAWVRTVSFSTSGGRVSLVIAASLVARHAARADHRLVGLRRRGRSSIAGAVVVLQPVGAKARSRPPPWRAGRRRRGRRWRPG